MADEIIKLTSELLVSIQEGDWKKYQELCHDSLTAFEPEANGSLVEGLDFHKFYFNLANDNKKRVANVTMSSPHVRLLGNTAVISYIRLIQTVDDNNRPITKKFEETRVWTKSDAKWVHVHFHRSAV